MQERRKRRYVFRSRR
ncbi:hypothetical protein M2937_13970 [Klebsiella pneumoniae]|nr:hypothetical protein [Klebsiella pneumoniae]